MRILFTGASSFTGMWFLRELHAQGHEITATFLQPYTHYQDIRKTRVDTVLPFCKPIFLCPFGSLTFLQTIQEGSHWDMLCHHAADVTDYKSPDFNYAEAVRKNTLNIKEVLQLLQKKNCNRLLLTGSVFEPGEGSGSEGLRAVSPYGLSKGLTSEVFRYFTDLQKMQLGKFVIPNPYGPYEEARFTTYLAKNWLQGKEAAINAPDYVRDNIPASLLAKSYAAFAQKLDGKTPYEKINPSLHPESQGEFTKRFALEMQKRFQLPCQYLLNTQTEFSEPKIRINTDPINTKELKWDEKAAWDDLGTFYKSVY